MAEVSPAEQLAKRWHQREREQFVQDCYAKFRSGNDVPVTRIRVWIPGLGDLFIDTIQFERSKRKW